MASLSDTVAVERAYRHEGLGGFARDGLARKFTGVVAVSSSSQHQ